MEDESEMDNMSIEEELLGQVLGELNRTRALFLWASLNERAFRKIRVAAFAPES